MKNMIKVTIPLSFKGVDHKPSAVLNLDHFVQKDQDLNFIFHFIATQNNIDPYSYEYEVLESSAMLFSEPVGKAAEYLTDNSFDIEGFRKNASEKTVLGLRGKIAKEMLDVEGLEANKALKKALFKAYQAGRDSV